MEEYGEIIDDKGAVKTIRFSRSDDTSIDLIKHISDRVEISDITM